jgi:hypothetical protein
LQPLRKQVNQRSVSLLLPADLLKKLASRSARRVAVVGHFALPSEIRKDTWSALLPLSLTNGFLLQ